MGRTARGGREGKAIVFLREEERQFVDFMKAHKVQLTQLHFDVEEAKQFHKERVSL